jgi:hypothetical protein
MNSLENDLKNFVNSNAMLTETDLCKTMKKHGSDKCSDWHNYTPVYSRIFSNIRHDVIDFFELGIYMGGSVKGWADYFRNSQILAGDVDKNYLVNNERIKSFICDQDDANSIRSLWENFSGKRFDVIIEDGKHEFFSNMNFFQNSVHMLKENGIFIIEDLTHQTQHAFEGILVDLKNSFSLKEVFVLSIPNDKNKIDNCVLIALK